jgi:dephospho-CoA kinase
MIIGITGSLGGGKGTVVDYLVEQKNFKHYSASGHLISLLEARGKVVNRDSLNQIGNELRANDPAGVAAAIYEQYERDDGASDVILESLHSPAEAQFIKSVGGIVLGVTADSDIRFERIHKRGSVKDNVTKEEFIVQQKREEEGTGDTAKSNIFATLEEADFLIENNGTLEELHAQIDKILEQIEI